MPFPAGSAKITYGGTLPRGEEFQFGYWAAFQASPGDEASFQAAFESLVDAQAAALASLMGDMAPSSVTITEARAYGYTGGTNRAAFVGVVPLNISGTGSATMPNQVSAVVTINSGLPGRSNRNRSYLPALKPPADASDGITMTATGIQTIATDFARVLNAVGSPPWSPRVVSGTRGAMVDAVSVTVDNKLDTQRRRAASWEPNVRRSALVNQL